MTEIIQYDDPDHITYMDSLKIEAVSKHISPKIYANGRNQLPIEITAKAVKKVDGSDDVPLNFSRETWIHILNLRHAQSDAKLSWQHRSGWCFTDKINDYSKEIEVNSFSNTLFSVRDDGTVHIIMYVYTDDIDTKRIAVSVDTDNGKHFTTSDKSPSSPGPEEMSVTVTALKEIIYRKDSLIITPIYQIGKGKNDVTYTETNMTSYTSTEYFDCHYDNYYITIPFAIMNAQTYGYGSVEGEDKWICFYGSEHDHQHMIVAHPYNKKGTETFGFHNHAHWFVPGFKFGSDWDATFNLTKNVTFNEKEDMICFTQIAFVTGSQWRLPDNQGLDKKSFSFDTWFELYDIYGNYGAFSVGFTDDHQYLQITDR